MAKAELEFEFEDLTLEDAVAATAVKRHKESQWRKVIEAFVASGKDSAIVRVDNGKTYVSQAASIGQQLRKAAEEADENGGSPYPVKVRARENGVIFINTDAEARMKATKAEAKA